MADDTPTPDDGGTPDTGKETPQEKTFTQAEMDKIISGRLERQKAQFGDVDDLKAKAERLEELESEGQTEAEKLRSQVEKAKQGEAQAKEREAHANERVKETLVRAEVLTEAAKQGATDPGDVYKLLDGEIAIDENGKVTGADTAVAALLKEKPHLAVRVQQGGNFGGGQVGVPAPAADGKQALNEQIRRQAGFTPQ